MKAQILFGVLLLLCGLLPQHCQALPEVDQDSVFKEVGDFKVIIDPQHHEANNAGVKPRLGQKIAVHYKGTFEDGSEFDSSYRRDKPFTFELGKGRVIKCWEEGFKFLSTGIPARIHCPSELAYGSKGAGKIIPPQ